VLQQRGPLRPAVGELLPHLLTEPALQLVEHCPVQVIAAKVTVKPRDLKRPAWPTMVT
jgi:hypothetical protein